MGSRRGGKTCRYPQRSAHTYVAPQLCHASFGAGRQYPGNKGTLRPCTYRNHDGVSAYCKAIYPKRIQPFGYAIQRSLMQPQHEVATVLNANWTQVQQSAKFNTWQ